MQNLEKDLPLWPIGLPASIWCSFPFKLLHVRHSFNQVWKCKILLAIAVNCIRGNVFQRRLAGIRRNSNWYMEAVNHEKTCWLLNWGFGQPRNVNTMLLFSQVGVDTDVLGPLLMISHLSPLIPPAAPPRNGFLKKKKEFPHVDFFHDRYIWYRHTLFSIKYLRVYAYSKFLCCCFGKVFHISGSRKAKHLWEHVYKPQYPLGQIKL